MVQIIAGLQNEPVQKISKAVAEEARYWGKSKEGRTPFSDNAQAHGYRYDGGKVKSNSLQPLTLINST